MQAEQTQINPLSYKDNALPPVLGYLTLAAAHFLLLLVAALGATLISAIILAAIWAIIIGSKLLIRPVRLIYIFIFLLPIYQLTLVLLFQFTKSTTLLSVVQPWKEILVFGALILILGYHVFIVQRIKIRLRLLDLLMLGYLGLNSLYLIAPFSTTFITRLYGFRSLTIMIFLYFLGRLVPLSQVRQKQIIKALLILAIAAGIFTLIDRFILPIDWPVRIGLPQFLAKDPSNEITRYYGPMGLPWTYWTSTGVRRSSSFFANPLDVAAGMHILGVAALVIMLSVRPRTKLHFMSKIAFAGAVLSLLLSISRTSIIAFAFECLLIAYFLRKSKLVIFIILLGILGLTSVLISPMGGYIVETVTLQNPSVIGHIEEWEEGYIAIFQTPWGLGPGTSGSTGARAGLQVGGESAYVIVGVQLGMLGLLLYIVLQLVAIRSAQRLFNTAMGVTQTLALITLVSRVGLMVIGLTANHEVYLFTTYISWWLIGWVNQMPIQTKPAVVSASLPNNEQPILQA